MVHDTVKIEPEDEEDDDNGIVFTVPVAVSRDDCKLFHVTGRLF